MVTINTIGKTQTLKTFADSVRIKYQIPALAYAVVSGDSIFELQIIGVQRANSNLQATQNDRFHIGSNTKAITSFIAALLVKQGKIKWETKIIDLFPELKTVSKKAYWNINLQDLLTFRGKLQSYSYGNNEPTKEQIIGDNSNQRYLLAKYFLSHEPMQEDENGLTPSNADYIMAGLMLEKASGKSYKELVTDFGKTQGIDFNFDYPNVNDSKQTWGHDENLNPLPPFDNYKLNWLLSAGNINVRLIDYLKFIQLQLKGLKGQTHILSFQTFDKLLYGEPIFSFGWFNKIETSTKHHVAYNEGNAGAFISQVQIIKEVDKGYIIFTNSATSKTSEGIEIILDRLQTRYGR